MSTLTRQTGWTRLELTVAALSAAIVLGPLLFRVDYSGAWDDDPAIHLRLTMEAVNVAVAELDSGGDPLRGILQCYYRFPKMLHDILLAGFVLAINGGRRINYGEAAYYGAWFSTLWSVVGVAALFHCLRFLASRLVVLIGMPLVCLSGYILHYANVPRQNMPAHAVAWIASALYLKWRTGASRLSPGRALALGLLFGISVPIHYTSVYWFFAIVGLGALVDGSRERRSWGDSLAILDRCGRFSRLVCSGHF